MTRLILVTAVLFALASTVQAQPTTTYPYNLNLRGPGLPGTTGAFGGSFGGVPGPNLSPYLNLLRGGNPAANYYLGVIPEVERRNNAAQFSAAILDLYRRGETVQEGTEDLLPTLPQTGHAVQFGNFGQYFGSSGFGARLPQQQPPPIASPRRR